MKYITRKNSMAKVCAEINYGPTYLRGARLSGDVDRIGDDGHLAEKRQFVVGQKAVRLVEQEISPNEFLETPIFTLIKGKDV